MTNNGSKGVLLARWRLHNFFVNWNLLLFSVSVFSDLAEIGCSIFTFPIFNRKSKMLV